MACRENFKTKYTLLFKVWNINKLRLNLELK